MMTGSTRSSRVSVKVPGYELMVEKIARRYVRDILAIDDVTQNERFNRVRRYSDSDFFNAYLKANKDLISRALGDGLNRSITVVGANKIVRYDDIYQFVVEFIQTDKIGRDKPKKRHLRAYLELEPRQARRSGSRQVRKSPRYPRPQYGSQRGTLQKMNKSIFASILAAVVFMSAPVAHAQTAIVRQPPNRSATDNTKSRIDGANQAAAQAALGLDAIAEEQARLQASGDFGVMQRNVSIGGQIQSAWSYKAKGQGVHIEALCDTCVYKVRLREYMTTAIVLPERMEIESVDLGDTNRFDAKRSYQEYSGGEASWVWG